MPHKVGKKIRNLRPSARSKRLLWRGVLNIRKSPADVTYTFPAGRF